MDFILDTEGDKNDENADETQSFKQSKSAAMVEFLKFKEELETCEIPKNTTNKYDRKKTLTKAIIDTLGSKDDKINRQNIKKGKERVRNILNEMQSESIALEVEKALAKSVVTPDFENLHSIPSYDISQKKLQQERRKEREKTKGKNWYGMPATEITEEVKRDLEILQMRSVLDPKHFYKKNDLKVLPKYFQVGKVMDSPLEFYNNRLTKKERKKTLVDELLADAEFQKYNKRKYKEIIEEKQKTHYKAWRQAKRLKKKK